MFAIDSSDFFTPATTSITRGHTLNHLPQLDWDLIFYLQEQLITGTNYLITLLMLIILRSWLTIIGQICYIITFRNVLIRFLQAYAFLPVFSLYNQVLRIIQNAVKSDVKTGRI